MLPFVHLDSQMAAQLLLMFFTVVTVFVQTMWSTRI
jgi:hypothetical protein